MMILISMMILLANTWPTGWNNSSRLRSRKNMGKSIKSPGMNMWDKSLKQTQKPLWFYISIKTITSFVYWSIIIFQPSQRNTLMSNLLKLLRLNALINSQMRDALASLFIKQESQFQICLTLIKSWKMT
jgi:hypothetical protein